MHDRIQRHEGTRKDGRNRHVLYRCPADKLTIGYGRNIEERGISESEARFLFENDLFDAINDAHKLEPDLSTWPQLAREVFIEMVFQMGMPSVAGFQQTRNHLRARRWKDAALEGRNSKWWREDTPERAEELMQLLESIDD